MFKRFKLTIAKNGGKRVVFSLPKTNHYQTIKDLFLHPKNYITINESVYKNRVVSLTLNDVNNNIGINFKYSGKTIKKNIDDSIKVSDYKKELLHKYSYLLQPNNFINGHDKKIKAIVNGLNLKSQNLKTILQKLNDFVLNYLFYGKPIVGLYPYNQAIGERITDCGGFSTLLLSLLASLNIPARLVVGFILNSNSLNDVLSTFNFLLMHVWPEALLPDGTWFPFDPALEWRRAHRQTKRSGGIGFIPNDRLVVSFGQDFKISQNGKIYKVELLQQPVYL